MDETQDSTTSRTQRKTNPALCPHQGRFRIPSILVRIGDWRHCNGFGFLPKWKLTTPDGTTVPAQAVARRARARSPTEQLERRSMKGFPVFLPVRLLLCSLALFLCLPAFAQEDVSINRYTLYTGFDYMISPARNLTQRGFDTDFGFTAKPWLGLGADFSASGNSFIS